jgi:hypothetical protein
MKTRILLLLSVALINSIVFGQSDHFIDLTNHNLFNHSKTGFDKVLDNNDEQPDPFVTQITNNRDLQDLWRLDSTISYGFVTDFDSIATNRRLYTYDDVNKTVEYTEITLSGPNSTWVNTNRNLWYFNDENLQIQNIQFKWTQDQWIKFKKIECTYNENDRPYEESYFTWDTINEKWLGNTKVEFGYNDQGLQNLLILYSIDAYTNDWVGFQKYVTTFNEAGLKETETIFRWSIDSGSWNNFERNTFTYEDGLSNHYYDFWDENEWKQYSRTEAFRIDTLTVLYDTYHFENDSIWVFNMSYKSKIRENEYGDIVFQESYRSMNSHDSWIGEVKFEKLANEFGQVVSNINYYWIKNEEWSYNVKFQTGYDEHNIPFYSSTSIWNIDENLWTMEKSATSYFKNISAINETNNKNCSITVFPNPCKNQLNLSIENQNDTAIHFKIHSVTGQLVDEGSVSSTNTITLNVEHLDKGFYLIQIDNGKTISTGKFMKL